MNDEQRAKAEDAGLSAVIVEAYALLRGESIDEALDALIEMKTNGLNIPIM